MRWVFGTLPEHGTLFECFPHVRLKHEQLHSILSLPSTSKSILMIQQAPEEVDFATVRLLDQISFPTSVAQIHFRVREMQHLAPITPALVGSFDYRSLKAPKPVTRHQAQHFTQAAAKAASVWAGWITYGMALGGYKPKVWN